MVAIYYSTRSPVLPLGVATTKLAPTSSTSGSNVDPDPNSLFDSVSSSVSVLMTFAQRCSVYLFPSLKGFLFCNSHKLLQSYGAAGVRTNRRMAYIRTILRELQITQ